MPITKYNYNPKTCQYERARLRWVDVAGYTVAIAFTALAFFIAILFVQNKIVKTDSEIALRKENEVLEKHLTQVNDALDDVEKTLTDLQSQEGKLGAMLFDQDTLSTASGNTVNQKGDILFADAESFETTIATLKERSSELAEKSAHTNAYIGSRFHLTAEDFRLLHNIPSMLPVNKEYISQLASGFGVRINPFHKGHYHHHGIDFVAPRGTAVLSTGNGRVIQAKRSALQAGYGNYIEIDHGNGFISRYAHLEEVAVRIGQTVTKGMMIGSVGNSGGSIAPHLHYEIIRDGDNVDPVHFMLQDLSSAEHRQLSALSKKQNQSLD